MAVFGAYHGVTFFLAKRMRSIPGFRLDISERSRSISSSRRFFWSIVCIVQLFGNNTWFYSDCLYWVFSSLVVQGLLPVSTSVLNVILHIFSSDRFPVHLLFYRVYPQSVALIFRFSIVIRVSSLLQSMVGVPNLL